MPLYIPIFLSYFPPPPVLKIILLLSSLFSLSIIFIRHTKTSNWDYPNQVYYSCVDVSYIYICIFPYLWHILNPSENLLCGVWKIIFPKRKETKLLLIPPQAYLFTYYIFYILFERSSLNFDLHFGLKMSIGI